MVTALLQLRPRCRRAQTANRRPPMVIAAPIQKGHKARRPELAVEPGQRDARYREQDDHDQEGEGPENGPCVRLEALGSFGICGLDTPIENKGYPHDGKERFIEPEHSGPPDQWPATRKTIILC